MLPEAPLDVSGAEASADESAEYHCQGEGEREGCAAHAWYGT